MLVVAFAFAGHYMGQNAIAHNVEPGEMLEPIVAPSSNIIAKGSLMPEGTSLEIVNLTSTSQTVASQGKGDVEDQGKTDVQPLPEVAAKTDPQVQIVPAAIDLKHPDDEPVKKLALTPPTAKIEAAVKLKRSAALEAAKPKKDPEAVKLVAQRRVQRAEMECLARAVYFEARSESELGQLAVAKVILNRVKDPEYPKSICGVVYQGSGRRNSCQFSFACDGLPDDVRSANAWSNAKRIAQKAISGDTSVAAIGSATNYHADYVRPKWAKSMKRLIKIGHHVFYEDS